MLNVFNQQTFRDMTNEGQTTNTLKEIPLMIYGMQRTGTNYTEHLLTNNLRNIKFHNCPSARCLPIHKHFRLYDEKFIIPDPQYFNTFSYKDFNSFKNHVESIVGNKISRYIVVIKHPFSWYSSYLKHAKRNKYHTNGKSFNSHFIIDYNHYYKKWLSFEKEAPDIVKIVKYEEVLSNTKDVISKLADTIGTSLSQKTTYNPKKVNMSKRFTNKRLKYYTNKKFLDLIEKHDKQIAINLLDEEFHHIYDLTQ